MRGARGGCLCTRGTRRQQSAKPAHKVVQSAFSQGKQTKTAENRAKHTKTHETGAPPGLRVLRVICLKPLSAPVSGNLHDFVTEKMRHNCALSTHTTGDRTCEHPNKRRPPRVHSSVRPRPTARRAPHEDSQGYPFSTHHVLRCRKKVKVFDKTWIAPLRRGVVPSGYSSGGVGCWWVEDARGAGRARTTEEADGS